MARLFDAFIPSGLLNLDGSVSGHSVVIDYIVPDGESTVGNRLRIGGHHGLNGVLERFVFSVEVKEVAVYSAHGRDDWKPIREVFISRRDRGEK